MVRIATFGQVNGIQSPWGRARVHGDTDLDKFRELDRDGENVPAVEAAVDHLRTAFAVLIKNPDLLDPTKIDGLLLTDAF
jgi:hypothetical protein